MLQQKNDLRWERICRHLGILQLEKGKRSLCIMFIQKNDIKWSQCYGLFFKKNVCHPIFLVWVKNKSFDCLHQALKHKHAEEDCTRYWEFLNAKGQRSRLRRLKKWRFTARSPGVYPPQTHLPNTVSKRPTWKWVEEALSIGAQHYQNSLDRRPTHGNQTLASGKLDRGNSSCSDPEPLE